MAYIDNFTYSSSAEPPVEIDEPIFDNLIWQDEFNGNGAVNSDKWFHQTQLPDGGSWYNGEIQHYTDRLENTSVSNGTLKITAKAEVFNDQGVTKNYTSARLNSKFAFTYGKVDIRAKLPTGVGTWPALWMLGKNISEDGAYWETQGFGTTGWPACGEIDIMEHWGDNQDYVSSAIHTPSSFGGTVNHGGLVIPNVSNEFHTYTVIWTEEYIRFKVDGNTHYTYNPTVKDPATWPFDLAQYLVLNIAIQPIISTSFTESTLEIDYIRIYQEDNLNQTEVASQDKIIVYPNPANDIVMLKNARNVNQFEVYNSLGLLVKKGKLEQSQINISTLTKGIYILKLKNADKVSFTRKLIKN